MKFESQLPSYAQIIGKCVNNLSINVKPYYIYHIIKFFSQNSALTFWEEKNKYPFLEYYDDHKIWSMQEIVAHILQYELTADHMT